jgi:putative transcriptional regulator
LPCWRKRDPNKRDPEEAIMRQADPPPPTSLEGQFLIAMPSLREGPFARSVVYMCAHRDDGAMGIVINHRAAEIDFGELLTQLDIVPEAEAIRLPPRAQAVRVLRGGPVETGRGFVLHSSDYGANDSTVKIGDGCPADTGLIFDPDFDRKYDRALAILGVDQGKLSSDAGHA